MSDLYKTLLISRPQVLSSGGSGLLTQANNLSDVADVTTARTNLGAASTLTVSNLPSTLAASGYIYSDGATSNRAQIYGPFDATTKPREWIAGAAGIDVVVRFVMPATGTRRVLCVWGPNLSYADVWGSSSGVLIVGIETTGQVSIRQIDSGGGYRSVLSTNNFSSRVGSSIFLRVRITNGVGVSFQVDGASYAANTETTIGSPVGWLSSTLLVPTYRMVGYTWPTGEAPVVVPVLGSLTDSETESWRTTGRPPAWVAAGGTMATQTSGTLTIGFRYRITSYVASDSFTNVGASSNATGVEFTATGTTPTTWTNSSVLIRIGALSIPSIQPILVLDDVTFIEGNQARLLGMTPVTERKDWRIVDSTATSGNEQILGGATFIEANRHRIDSWVINNLGTSKTVSLGNASAGTQYASSITAAVGLTEVTPSTRFNATTALWANSNGTDQLVHTITGHRLGSS